MNEEIKEGTIIDIKQFGGWLVISYRGEWGISFEKLRVDEGVYGVENE